MAFPSDLEIARNVLPKATEDVRIRAASPVVVINHGAAIPGEVVGDAAYGTGEFRRIAAIAARVHGADGTRLSTDFAAARTDLNADDQILGLS